MNRDYRFKPPIRGGLVFHSAIILFLILVSGWGIWQATNAQVVLLVVLYLLLSLLAVFLIPLLAYRMYALWRASYLIERDGFRLYWGLREVGIPMHQVQWVHSSTDLDLPLRLPRLRWPGSVYGEREQLDGTRIEYLSAHRSPLILIATGERTYAISPTERDEFLRISQQFAELGSLTPFPARSSYPSFLLAEVWAVLPVRFLLIAGLVLTLSLFVIASLLIPSHPTVLLRFNPAGSLADSVPSIQVLLLPLINGFFYLADVLLGMFFFRRQGEEVIAYILWGCGVFTSLLFMIALFSVMARS